VEIDWVAALLGAIAAFAVGAVWYSPALFAKAWQQEAALTDAQLRGSGQAQIFGAAFLLLVVASLVFAVFLGPEPTPEQAVGAGFGAGLAWVAGGLGVTYLFERRSPKLFLINGGYLTIAFTVIGLVHALWN
jgi:hypothetical protein